MYVKMSGDCGGDLPVVFAPCIHVSPLPGLLSLCGCLPAHAEETRAAPVVREASLPWLWPPALFYEGFQSPCSVFLSPQNGSSPQHSTSH